MAFSVSEMLLNNMNASVDSVNEDGSIDISRQMSDGSTMKIKADPKQAAQLAAKISGQSLDESMPLQITSPNAPVNDSGLSFGQQVAFVRAKTKSDKLNYLKEQFGADNVKIVGGEPVIKGEDGNWKRGEMSSGWKGAVAGLTEAVPTIGGAIAGSGLASTAAIAGLGLASLTPLGAAIVAGSAIAGAGLGSVVGKASDIATANALGIRNELDAAEVSKELGHEFLLGAAGEGIGLGLQLTPALFSKAMNKIKNLSVNSPAVRNFMADGMSITTGLDRPTVNMAINHGDDMKGAIQMEVAHDIKKVQGAVVGLSPSEMRVNEMLAENLVKPFKEAGEELYGEKLLEASKLALTKGGKIDVKEPISAMLGQMKNAGILDSKGNLIVKTAQMTESDMVRLNKNFKDFFELVQNRVAKTDGNWTLKELLDFEMQTAKLGKVEQALAGGAEEPSLRFIRELIGGTFKPQVEQKMIAKFGDGIRDFIKFRGDYSKFLDNMDIISAIPNTQAPKTALAKMFAGQNSSTNIQSLLDIGKFVGREDAVNTVLQGLQLEYATQQIAGKLFAKEGASGITGFLGKVKDLAISPRVVAPRLGSFINKITSPSIEQKAVEQLMRSSSPLADLIRPASQVEMQVWDKLQGRPAKQKLDQSRVLELSTMGKAVSTFNSLNEKQKQVLYNSPQLMQQLIAPMAQVKQSYQQTAQVLKQQTAQKIKGGGQR